MVAYKIIRFVDNLIDKIIIVVFLVVFLFGCYFVVDSVYVFYNASSGGVKGRRQEQTVEEIMKELSSDAVGWIRMDDSKIDYPIMQTNNNTKYLNIDPYGDYNIAGSIFLDFRNASDFSDQYNILYGHHMENNYMFGALDLWEDKEYFDTHRDGVLILDGVEYKLNAFAFVVVKASAEEVFDPEFAKTARTFIQSHAQIYYEPGDGRILMLSTCRNAGATERTLVYTEILDSQGGGAN